MQTYAIRSNAWFLDGSYRQYPLTIHDLPADEKPREKMIGQGPEALSVKELLAVLLITGTSKESLLDLSSRIIREYGEKSILSERNAATLSTTLDIPLVKACQIVACGELGRRFYAPATAGFVTIRSAKDVFDYLSDMRSLPKEHLRGLYLNSHNRIIRDEVISIGTVNSNIVHPREVFRAAIECNAAAVVLAHNHPSGEDTPSAEDTVITQQLISAGRLLGINVLDHVIITKDSFRSIQADY